MIPPKDIPASELFQKLMETPEPSEIVDYPRKGPDGLPIGKLRIRVLRMEQHDEARIRAHQALKKRNLTNEDLQGATIKEVLADQCAREVLAMACTGTEPNTQGVYARVFRSAEDVSKLTADEITVLFTQYQMVQDKYGPYEGNIGSDEELNAWIRRLKEGAAAFPLAQLNSQALAELIMSLADRAYSACALLESLSESSPSILESVPESWGIGTGYFGSEPASSTADGSENSGADDSGSLPAARDDELLTLDDALEVAKRLHQKR